MRLRFCVPLSLFALTALSQESSAPKVARQVQSYEEFQKVRVLMNRAYELEPRRRDTPLRELNITDNEVREIEVIARRELLSSMLNISPVIAGCACEEGPFCTDQVYVVATTADSTIGLQLSRIRRAWVVGPVQQWWRRYEELQRRGPKGDFQAFIDAKSVLLHEFPMCVGSDPEPDQKVALTK